MSDLISRQAAIDGFYEMASDMDHLCTVSDYVSFLESLPSAQPEPLTVTIDYEPSKDVYDRLKQAMRDAPILLLPSAQTEIIRCKDCKHRPFDSEDTQGFGVEFPDEKCPCQCDDFWYNWRPDDEWFCADAERRTDDA